MARIFGYFLCLYFAFAWQATLRPMLDWNGCSPNFLALALIGSCIVLTDTSALIAAAVLGLLSDCLVQRGLGHDVICYVAVCIALQAICPPKLARHPAVLLAILIGSVLSIELAGVCLRAVLNHELAGGDSQSRTRIVQWAVNAFGDGISTAVLALPVLIIGRGWTTSSSKESSDGFANRWHRLTSA